MEKLRNERDEKVRSFEDRISAMVEARRETGNIINGLFDDPQFLEMISQKMKETKV